MKCKNCERTDVYVNDEDGLCDDCYDFVAGYSSYDPAAPNPMLKAVQAMLDDNDGYDDEIDDDDSDRENW